MRRSAWSRWVVGLMLVFGLGVSAWAAEPGSPQPKAPLSLRLVSAQQAQPLEAPVWESANSLFFSLRSAVTYCGGSVSWNPASQKALVQTPQGRKLLISPGYPKAVVDDQQFVHLPATPILRQSQIMITPETFTFLWKALGNPAPIYSATDRIIHLDTLPPATTTPSMSTSSTSTSSTTSMSSTPPKSSFTHPPLCIVVDAGHGGKDPGAVGPTHAYEKEVVLDIALQLAALLEKELGGKVILTRSDDRFIPLSERPQIANQAKADLFVSIHANASRDRTASGSQVYIYNREASSSKAAEAARLENKDANYLEIIKDDLRQSIHEEGNVTAAGLVGQALEKNGLPACRIERAPFYVLAKSHMPSILVETAFISNHDEEAKLRRSDFRRQIARGIFQGIQEFAKEQQNRK